MVLLCFIAESNALEVIFGQGKNYSQCPSSLTSTVLILDCVPGEDWEYSGNKGNASSYLVVIEPAPGGGCMVCFVYNTHTHMHAHTHTHVHTHVHTHTHARTHTRTHTHMPNPVHSDLGESSKPLSPPLFECM